MRKKTTFTLITLEWTPEVESADVAIVIKLDTSLKRTTSLTMDYRPVQRPLELFVHPLSPSPVVYVNDIEDRSVTRHE